MVSVMELCRIFDIKQSAMSHHVKVLANAGLVTRRREGNSLFYRRTYNASEPVLQSMQQALFATIDSLPLAAQTAACLQQVQHERSSTAEQFFSQNAAKFRQQQELIAQHEQYAELARELVDQQLSQHPEHGGTALEIGPGHGEFLGELSQRFQRVIALDISSEMLVQAREFATQQQLNNIDFLLGDTATALEHPVQAHCIACNMVLHHVPSPAEIFQHAARLLQPGGALIISDLCSHDQNWTRDACGDLWLGFDPEDLNQWARQAGLLPGPAQYVALRNGFRIQECRFSAAPAMEAPGSPFMTGGPG